MWFRKQTSKKRRFFGTKSWNHSRRHVGNGGRERPRGHGNCKTAHAPEVQQLTSNDCSHQVTRKTCRLILHLQKYFYFIPYFTPEKIVLVGKACFRKCSIFFVILSVVLLVWNLCTSFNLWPAWISLTDQNPRGSSLYQDNLVHNVSDTIRVWQVKHL